MILVAVGSRNPVKVAAASAGFGDSLGPVVVIGVEAASDVAAQPMGDDETIRGAMNRAGAALAAVPDADFGVGLEGGVVPIGGALYCCAWCAVVDRNGAVGLASTGRCELPPPVADLIRAGMELGDADDQVFGRENSKQGEGAVGLLTRGRIDRASFYAPAVTMALARFLSAEVFAPTP
jgi:inosine/xanthosine triphosphatase